MLSIELDLFHTPPFLVFVGAILATAYSPGTRSQFTRRSRISSRRELLAVASPDGFRNFSQSSGLPVFHRANIQLLILPCFLDLRGSNGFFVA
jgi:hypothetical protein